MKIKKMLPPYTSIRLFIASCSRRLFRRGRLGYGWQVLKELLGLGMFVTLDPRDNSVTLSRRLFNHMRRQAKDGDPARVFVFKLPATIPSSVPASSAAAFHAAVYAFCVNPDIEQPTQYCDIQVNDRYHCIGFETLCPSAGQIAYTYNLPHDRPSRLSVRYVKIEPSVHGDSVAGQPQLAAYYELTPPHHND